MPFFLMLGNKGSAKKYHGKNSFLLDKGVDNWISDGDEMNI